MSLDPLDVQKLYVAYLGRPADAAGFRAWSSANITLNEAANMFSQSPEYAALHSSNTTVDIIVQSYQFLFNKTPDVDGLRAWYNAVEFNHTIPKSLLPLAIANGANLYDSQVAYSKYIAAAGFTNHLDTTAEIINYPTAAGEKVGRDYLASITAFSYPSPAEIDAWIRKIPGAGFAAEQHFDKALAAFGDVAQDVSVAHHQDQQHDVIDGHASLIGQHGHTLLEAVY